jgi:solute carrier family 25 (mitochondrial S-adenosylmethionine transporter), member 26
LNLNSKGIRGLYKGYWIGLMTYGPFVAIYWTLYEQFKILSMNILKKESTEDLPFYGYLVSSAVGSGISAVVTCPLDVIKTRIQVNHDHKQYKNSLDALVTIYKEEGFKALFNGVKPRSLWMSGGTAVTMVFCKILIVSEF